MPYTEQERKSIKQELVASLCHEPEISKIVVFGSFLDSNEPHDLDVAVFQTSDQDYLPLALRYRKKKQGDCQTHCVGYSADPTRRAG